MAEVGMSANPIGAHQVNRNMVDREVGRRPDDPVHPRASQAGREGNQDDHRWGRASYGAGQS